MFFVDWWWEEDEKEEVEEEGEEEEEEVGKEDENEVEKEEGVIRFSIFECFVSFCNRWAFVWAASVGAAFDSVVGAAVEGDEVEEGDEEEEEE